MDFPTSAYPLQWPAGVDRTPAEFRDQSRFSHKSGNGWQKPLTAHQAIERLMTEIDRFTKHGHEWRIVPGAVIVSTDMRVRKDGLPYSSDRLPDDPGCAIYLHLDDEPYVFPCDHWDRLPDNIAAVAAHLGAMRGIERWGVGTLNQVFAGFSALPPPDQVEGERTVQRTWYGVLGVPEDAERAQIEKAYKILRSRHHPDRGGDKDRFDEIQRAYREVR